MAETILQEETSKISEEKMALQDKTICIWIAIGTNDCNDSKRIILIDLPGIESLHEKEEPAVSSKVIEEFLCNLSTNLQL